MKSIHKTEGKKSGAGNARGGLSVHIVAVIWCCDGIGGLHTGTRCRAPMHCEPDPA